MGCFVNILSNIMKSALNKCISDCVLVKIADAFRLMKKIVEDSKRNGWNSMLPVGYRLVQDVETRFGSHYRVAERFLKSVNKV